MIVAIIAAGVVAVILFGAIRIILGWILPAETLKRFDAALSRSFRFIFKLWVVATAGLIVWLIYLAATTQS